MKTIAAQDLVDVAGGSTQPVPFFSGSIDKKEKEILAWFNKQIAIADGGEPDINKYNAWVQARDYYFIEAMQD